MADRIPLIVNSLTEQIQELPVGDNLDIGNGDVVNVRNLVGNTVTAGTISIIGNLDVASIINVETITGNLVRGNTISVSNFVSDSMELTGSANIAGNLEVGSSIAADTISGNTVTVGSAVISGNLSLDGNFSAPTSKVTVSSIYAQSYFYANGTPFVGGGDGGGGIVGVTGNFDGGSPGSIYGGIPVVDGGTVSN